MIPSSDRMFYECKLLPRPGQAGCFEVASRPHPKVATRERSPRRMLQAGAAVRANSRVPFARLRQAFEAASRR